MTVSNTPRRAGPFNGNGATTAFPFTFKVFAASDVAVYLTDGAGVQTLLGANYTVTLNADQDATPGGTINYPTAGAPLPVGQKLDVVGSVPLTQTTDLTNLGRFLPQVIENALDRLTIFAQQLLERATRALTYPVGETASAALPAKDARKGTVLAFDEANGEPMAGPSLSTVGTVAAAIGAVSTVAGSIGNVNTTAGSIGSVNTTAANIGSVNTVAANIGSVNTVAGSIASVNTAAANMAAIVDAPNQAAAAAASRAAVDNRLYPGTYAVAPAKRPDGSAIQAGDEYFNGTANLTYHFNGAQWVSSDINTANLAASTGASLVGFKLSYAAAAVQDLQTTLRNTGGVSATQFMLPADIADLALATPLRDQTANIQAAIDSGAKKILLPAGAYRIDGTIRLRDGTQLLGASSLQTNGTSLRFTKTDGTHCFDSDAALFLSAITVQGMEIVNINNPAGTVGAGDCFHLFALTNNCKFKDVLVRNFGGSAWAIGKQTTNVGDKTAAQNVLFEQCFPVSCGGYAFDINGYANATWLMCDLNSCATGFWRFQDGTTNQTMINVVGCWVEGTQAWSALTVFDMQGTNGQMLNLIACNFTNSRAGTSRIVKSSTNSCRINVSGVTGFGWTYLHEDTPAGVNAVLSTPSNYMYQPEARQLVLRSASPVLDLFQESGGTVDQRRFRWSISGGKFLLTARNDAGGSVRNLLSINFNDGSLLPEVDASYTSGATTNRWLDTFSTRFRPGAGGPMWTSGAGSPEGVLAASVGSLYTRTDGGAGTTLYVKESGAGNTGWVAK